MDCQATLIVEYKYSDPYNVLITLSGEHSHVLGDKDDVKRSQHSKESVRMGPKRTIMYCVIISRRHAVGLRSFVAAKLNS